MANMAKKYKRVIGAEEWCALRDLGIPAIKARIDSGAKTSSMHAFNIQTFKKYGALWVTFEINPLQNNRRTIIRCEAEVVDRREVKSSTGVPEKRYVIKTDIYMGNTRWPIELTLSNRDSMGYRMLLGREAMKDRFLVDPSEACLLGGKSQADITKLYTTVKPARTGLNIAILASNPDLYSNERLIAAGEERGHNMTFLSIKQCFMKLDAEEPEIYGRGGRIIQQLDAVIPRIKPAVTFYGAAMTHDI